MTALRFGIILTRYLCAWVFTLCVAVLACVMCVFLGGTRMWLSVAQNWARACLWILGVRLDVVGLDNLQRGPAVFICNHESLMDVVFMPALLPRTVRMVAKRELLYVPFVGWAFAAGGAMLVDRSKPRQALRNLLKELDRLPKGWSLFVFPEGTRSKDGTLKPFKKGAFHMAAHTKLPVVPIGLSGARAIVPADGWLVRPGVVQVNVGEPIDTQGWEVVDAPQHRAAGFAAVAQCVEAARARRAQPEPPAHVEGHPLGV
jgi:1-acyl-sn-glycerol-3-phosphate acyltransferase